MVCYVQSQRLFPDLLGIVHNNSLFHKSPGKIHTYSLLYLDATPGSGNCSLDQGSFANTVTGGLEVQILWKFIVCMQFQINLDIIMYCTFFYGKWYIIHSLCQASSPGICVISYVRVFLGQKINNGNALQDFPIDD